MSGNNRQNRYGNSTKSGRSTMVIRNEKHSNHSPSNAEATEELFTRHSKSQKTNNPKTNVSPSQNNSNIYNKTPKKSPNYASNPFQRRGQENKKSTPSRLNTRDTIQHAQHTPQDSNDEDYFEDGEFELESDQYYINNDENYDQGYGQEEVFAEDEYYQDVNDQSYIYENGNYDNNGYQNEDYQDDGYQNDVYHNEEYQGEEYPNEYYKEEEYQDNNVVYNEGFQESGVSTGNDILNTEFRTTNISNSTSLNTYHEEDPDFLYPDGVDFMEARKIQDSQRAKYIKLEKIPDPNKRYRLEDAMTVIGTCEAMCPQFEIIQREFERKIDKNEKDPATNLMDKHKMVKGFSRSAAGQSTPLPNELRTINALEATTNYLIKDLMAENTFTETHTFIRDRTRQIRKDISVQHIFSLKAVSIYETIARFHILGLRHCISIQDNMKLEKEEFSRTLVGLKDQYLELHKKNKLKHELEFFAYYTLNFLETESDVRLPFRCISDQADANKRDLISFVLKVCDLYSTITDDDSIIQEFNETKKDPLARVKEFFSVFSQKLWDFPIYLVTIICEKVFDSVRYKALKIFQCIQKNCTAKFTSYPLKLFIANLHFDNKDEAEGFLTKYSFKTFVNNGVEKIHIKFNTPLPGKPLETVVIGCDSIVQPLRLHCESLTDIDLIMGKVDYNAHSTIDIRPIYKEFDPDSVKSEFTAMSPPVLPSGFNSDKFRSKTSPPDSAFSNFPNTLADSVATTSGSSTDAFKNSSNAFGSSTSNISTGGFQTSASTNSDFPSSPFGMPSSVPKATGPLNPFGRQLNTQKDSAFNNAFTSANSSQAVSSFIPNFTSSKSEASTFLAGNSFSNPIANFTSGTQPSSSIPLNAFKTSDTQPTFVSSLEQKIHEKLPLITSRPKTPPVIEQSPPPSPVSFQSFITFNWQSRKKTVDQILSRIPIINPKKHKYLTTPENDSTTARVSSLTQTQVKSILKANLRNRLILSIKKAIQEYALQLINVYLPAAASLRPVEKFNTWKNYRETLHRLSSGQLVSAAYATFETGQYSIQIRDRISFESKCLWTHIPSRELFELLSAVKSVPQNHKHFVTICIPQSSWDLHLWYKERLRLEFDKSGEFLIKKLKIFHNSEVEIRVVPRELPIHLFETKGCGFETFSYSLVYCMGLPSLNWIDSDYWNQESSHLFKFLATIPNKFLSIQASLLINYTHPTANSVSDFQYKSVEQLLSLYKYVDRMNIISSYGTHITNGYNLADHPVDILRYSYLLNSSRI